MEKYSPQEILHRDFNVVKWIAALSLVVLGGLLVTLVVTFSEVPGDIKVMKNDIGNIKENLKTQSKEIEDLRSELRARTLDRYTRTDAEKDKEAARQELRELGRRVLSLETHGRSNDL